MTLSELLSTTEGHASFAHFLRKQFSLHSLRFWFAVEDFKSMINDQKICLKDIRKWCRVIYDNYISYKGCFTIAISGEIRYQITDTLTLLNLFQADDTASRNPASQNSISISGISTSFPGTHADERHLILSLFKNAQSVVWKAMEMDFFPRYIQSSDHQFFLKVSKNKCMKHERSFRRSLTKLKKVRDMNTLTAPGLQMAWTSCPPEKKRTTVVKKFDRYMP